MSSISNIDAAIDRDINVLLDTGLCHGHKKDDVDIINRQKNLFLLQSLTDRSSIYRNKKTQTVFTTVSFLVPANLVRSCHIKKLHSVFVQVYQHCLGRFISHGRTWSESRIHMTSESAHVILMGRQTPKKSNALLVKYICCGFLAFNIVYSAALFLVLPLFLKLFLNYMPFFIAFFLSIVIAALGIIDRQYILLFPLLVFNACFGITSLALCTYLLTNAHFCTKHRSAYIAFIEDKNTTTQQFNQYFDCTLLDLYVTGWDSIKVSFIAAIALIIVAIEKNVELYYFIRMQIHFFRMRHPPTMVGCQSTALKVSEIMDDGGLRETEDEDEMVIYQKSAREVCEVAATLPPFGNALYRSRTIA